MNIYDYIDEYGIYSFSEKEFNEVDSAIFSFLSYADFSNIFEGEKMTIQEIGRKHIGLHSKKENNVIVYADFSFSHFNCINFMCFVGLEGITFHCI